MSHNTLVFPALAIALCLTTLPISADEKAQKGDGREELLKTFRSEFVAIKPGQDRFPQEFEFGPKAESKDKAVKAVLATGFEVSKFEVYQGLYEAVVGSNPSRWKGVRNSVDSATFEGADEFCRKATKLMRSAKLIDADQVVRLPTEAEWEYCCRAGTSTDYSFGDNPRKDGDTGTKASLLAEYSWHQENSPGNDPEVGVLKPNPWGLYDMHGYIWEICADEWTESLSDAATTPQVPHTTETVSKRHVIRGGSWKDSSEFHKSSSRRPFISSQTDDSIGFRCVIAKEPE